MRYLEGKDKVPDEGWMHYLPYMFLIVSNTLWPLSWLHSNEHNINAAQTTYIRGICTAGFNYWLCRWKGYDITDKSPHDCRVSIKRNILLTINCVFMALSHFILPQPVLYTLNCSGILVIYLFDYFLYGTSINLKQAIGIVIGFVGVLLNINGNLLKSWLDPGYEFHTTFVNYLTEDPLQRSIYACFMFLTVCGWAYAIVCLKEYRTQNSIQINYYMGVYYAITGALIYPLFTNQVSLGRLGLGFLFTGIPVTLAQFFFVAGLTMSKETGTLSMVNFLNIVIAYFVSIFRYNQKPNQISIVGILLVTYGVYMAIFKKTKAKQASSLAP